MRLFVAGLARERARVVSTRRHGGEFRPADTLHIRHETLRNAARTQRTKLPDNPHSYAQRLFFALSAEPRTSTWLGS
jgi:hypothetical protein